MNEPARTINAAHAKNSAMGLPIGIRLSEEELGVMIGLLGGELYCSH
jgi:hypothetical protein